METRDTARLVDKQKKKMTVHLAVATLLVTSLLIIPSAFEGNQCFQ